MEINSPVEMVKAIDLLILQMDKQHRKGFLTWVKERRKQYDMLYPMGWKPPEPEGSKPSILVPENSKTTIIIPEGVKNEPSKDVSTNGVDSDIQRSSNVVSIPVFTETPQHDA